jgi:FKBP-type peptidyl-prolyl cis-trans isomerase (trigger factor)
MTTKKNFSFSISNDTNNSHIATITISQKAIDSLYKKAIRNQQTHVETKGFEKGDVPLYYIEHNYQHNIVDHLKEFFFMHCVINTLYNSLCKHKVAIVGEPALKSISLKPHESAQFCFSIVKAQSYEPKWKKLSIKAPDRKYYKDLDRQVESFLKEEESREEECTDHSISSGDWVCIDLTVYDSRSNEPLLSTYKDCLWIKISSEEIDKNSRGLFIGKKVGDEFVTDDAFFQSYVSNKINMNYVFHVTITDIVSHSYFCTDFFKHHFQIKNQKDTHLKLIEVFSSRNDISQRRETVEAVFKTLLKHYFITLPPHILEQEKKVVLKRVHDNPDYLVYKSQPHFKDYIRQLAEKQLKETIIIDNIAYQEDITVSHKDIVSYLNLNQRARTKEFIYFGIPETKLHNQEMPLALEILKQQCLREKTLNYVIRHITGKR